MAPEDQEDMDSEGTVHMVIDEGTDEEDSMGTVDNLAGAAVLMMHRLLLLPPNGEDLHSMVVEVGRSCYPLYCRESNLEEEVHIPLLSLSCDWQKEDTVNSSVQSKETPPEVMEIACQFDTVVCEYDGIKATGEIYGMYTDLSLTPLLSTLTKFGSPSTCGKSLPLLGSTRFNNTTKCGLSLRKLSW